MLKRFGGGVKQTVPDYYELMFEHDKLKAELEIAVKGLKDARDLMEFRDETIKATCLSAYFLMGTCLKDLGVE
jgi:hypothetical protein